VETESSSLLRERDYPEFVRKYGPAMQSIQDAVGKLMLVRLSLPIANVNSSAVCG